MDRADEGATTTTSSSRTVATLVPLETAAEERVAAGEKDVKAERRLKDAVRRYYALAELIETERGYVDDLKILVEVYLASLGANTVPAMRPRAESQPAVNPDHAERALFSSHRLGSDATSSRSSRHAYQYPPSSFPSSAGVFKDHVEMRPKSRARPASLQMLAALQPQAMRVRKDSGPQPHSMIASGSATGSGAHSRTRSTGFGLAGAPAVCTQIRRASVDVVQTETKAIYDTALASSPESSPHPSPLYSPSPLPSIPSTPLSSQPASPLPSTSHLSRRHHRLRTSVTFTEKQVLARDVQDILVLHERIVRGIEDALGKAQETVVARRKALKGKGRAGNEFNEVECEVDAAVRGICRVFTSEAPNFAPYEVFCAGHTEALETVRRIMRGHSSDWVEWEKQCAETAVRRDIDGSVTTDPWTESPLSSPLTPRPIAQSMSGSSLFSNAGRDVEDANSSTSTLRRRHSADASSGSLRASTSGTLKHTKSDPTPPAAGHSHKGANIYGSISVQGLARRRDGFSDSQTPGTAHTDKERQLGRSKRTKLAFADYLIKPVQRLCKYPLLFELLRTKRKESDESPPASRKSPLETGESLIAAATSVSARRVSSPDPDTTPKKKKTQATFHFGGDSDGDDESDEIASGDEEDITNVAVENVLRKMREVAHAVDEAQRRRDLEKKSYLIVERLVAGTPNVNHGTRPISDAVDEEKDQAKGDGLESHSELGHGIGTVSPSASMMWSNKPPTRSLSFSSAFSRSRSRNSLARMSSAFAQYQQQKLESSKFGELRMSMQIPGPPTRAFLTSLGACLLAGSLDVVVTNIENWPLKSNERTGSKRDSTLSIAAMSAMSSNNGLATSSSYISQSSREPVKVKYLAAFLYVGGYIVLAKTPKAGVYEPRHWFALTDETIEIVNVREEKALLPCSFHLVFHATGHRLELAAACQREKEIWLNAMHHARNLPPTWEYEPVPTLNISASLVNTHASRNSVEVPPVPAISASAINDDGFTHDSNPSRMSSNATLRADGSSKSSRRQSVNASTMRAFFSNNSDNGHSARPTVLIRRVSATRRAQTDRHLADVLSQPLLSARFHAKAHDEVLFRDPDPPQQGTGIGVGAMAKNKLMGRESVLISKQYAPSTCSSISSICDHRSMISEATSNVTVQQSTSQQSTKRKNINDRRSKSSLSMLLTLPGAISDASIRDSRILSPSSQETVSPNSPLPSMETANSLDPFSSSRCSSTSTSAPMPSPVNELFPPEVRVFGVDNLAREEGEELPEVLAHMDRPKRSHSLVDNFRGFFGTPRSISSSPAPSMSSSRQTSVEDTLEVPDAQSTPQKSMFSKILRRASLRPRGRSALNLGASEQTFESSSQASIGHNASTRASFISRSSSMLAFSRRKTDSSVHSSTRIRATAPAQTPTRPARLNNRPSRSSIMPDERNHMSLSRSIKYRLFPGNLVPLTPIESPSERLS